MCYTGKLLRKMVWAAVMQEIFYLFKNLGRVGDSFLLALHTVSYHHIPNLETHIYICVFHKWKLFICTFCVPGVVHFRWKHLSDSDIDICLPDF